VAQDRARFGLAEIQHLRARVRELRKRSAGY
jgi:hypothetical protein